MSTLADLPEVVGFFSYSREDDESYKGRLSALREAVQGELGAQLGRSKASFRLWQDKEAIAPGRLWESEIKNAIEQSVFFIPIVTPRAINSDYCKFEFEAFLARERELGRANLVFPILYVPVPALINEAQWRNHPVLSAVARRQYVDWQTFRYTDVHTPAMREEIARFCRTIVEALYQSWLTPEERKRDELEAAQRAEEESRRRQAEADRRAEEEARRRQDAENRRLASEAGRPPKLPPEQQAPGGATGAALSVSKPHPDSSRRVLLIGGGVCGAAALAGLGVILSRESNNPSAETAPAVSQPAPAAPSPAPPPIQADNTGLVGSRWTGVANGGAGRQAIYFTFQADHKMQFLWGDTLTGYASPVPAQATAAWNDATWTLTGNALHIDASGTWDGTVTGNHMEGSGQNGPDYHWTWSLTRD
jgi:hypothetical protein